MRASVARVVLATGVGLGGPIVAAEPAAACSCEVGSVPSYDFTGVAVEDLGYAESDSSLGLGETRAWVLEVTDARRGVAEGEVRISMAVGQIVNDDDDDGSGSVGGCGLDDNLIISESYDVTSVGLDDMTQCGSLVDGPRAEVPVRSDDDGRLRDLLVIFGTGAIVLLLAGILVVRAGRRS